jgi:hypothetical protein
MGKGTVIPMPADAPKAGEVHKHYKGDLYKIIGLALNSDNNAPEEQWLVVYEPMYEHAAAPLFARPLSHWYETVEWEGKSVARFSKT